MKAFVRTALRAMPLLGILAFWGGIGMAGWRYPAEFDWRYMTLSSLLSSSHNPAGHLWASLGIVLSGGCCGCWALWLARQGDRGRPAPPWGLWALGWGSLCVAWVGLLPRPVPGLRKGHELLTLVAVAAVCLGIVGLTAQLASRKVPHPGAGGARRPRLVATALASLAVLPILLAGGAQAYVFSVRPVLPWVGLAWRARGVPVYLSLAFWEWVTCAVLSGYLVILCLALGRRCGRQRDAERG